MPHGTIALAGPVARPAAGTLPLRGDLAHIALASRYLVPVYAMPTISTVADQPVDLRLQPQLDAKTITRLAAGSRFELLDTAGNWSWGCVGPDGPSGWVPADALTVPA
ncbi:MAG: SH3 domain-containing protein [Parerythrobacter sp.]